MTAGASPEERSVRIQELSRRVLALTRQIGYSIDEDDDLDDLERDVQRIEAMPEAQRRQAMAAHMTGREEAKYLRRVGEVNDVLVPVGRCLSPVYITNSEFTEILAACRSIAAHRAGGTDYSAELASVSRRIALAYFDPLIRAFMLHRARNLPHLQTVSHYLEDATLHFYRRNYFACANTLVVAVERLLLDHIGWTYLVDRPIRAQEEIRTRIAALTSVATDPRMVGRFSEYRRHLLAWLEIFQERSDRADLSVTQFVRSIVLHVNEPGSYYGYEHCLTAFQFFDLYIEVLAMQYGVEVYGLVPDTFPDILERRRLYWMLILSDWLHGSYVTPEESFLRSNSRYVPEGGDTNYLSMYGVGAEQNRAVGHAMYVLGFQHHTDIAPLLGQPVDDARLGLAVTLLAGIIAMRGSTAPQGP